MQRVTRDIDPGEARDLLERVPRACICFVTADGPQAVPVTLRYRDGDYLIGVSGPAEPLPGEGDEVVLLVDEGIHFFDLRAIYVRGAVQVAAEPLDAPGAPGRSWFGVTPSKTVAWDYGRLRTVPDAPR